MIILNNNNYNNNNKKKKTYNIQNTYRGKNKQE